MTKIFEADLCPETFNPRVRFNFSNGWAASVVMRMGTPDGTRFALASLAACPSGKWGTGRTELGENEASPDEVAAFIAEVAARPQAVAS